MPIEYHIKPTHPNSSNDIYECDHLLDGDLVSDIKNLGKVNSDIRCEQDSMLQEEEEL